MTSLFYILGLFLFIFRLPMIFRWKSIFTRSVYISKWKGVTKKEYKFDPKKDLPITISALLMGSTILWSVIGLMSSNWFLFSIILGLSILINIFHSIFKVIIKNYLESNFKLMSLLIVLTLNTGLILLIVLNHFHLNLNFLELIQNYL